MNKVKINNKKINYKKIYQRDGYVALKKVFKERTLLRLRDDISLLVDQFDHSIDNNSLLDLKLINLEKTNQEQLHKFQIEASKLISLNALLYELYEVLGPFCNDHYRPRLEGIGYVLGIPGSSRLSYDWHQDGSYHENAVGSRLHVWFPIFHDATINNGCMTFLEDSHKIGILNYTTTNKTKDGYTTNLVQNIDDIESQSKKILCELEVGDCVFFSDSIIHKSNENLSNLCRIAGVFKITFVQNSQKNISIVGV